MPVQLSFADERVLAVMAHPDDAELLCAGTLARARADGAAIGLCVLCRGDKGQPVTPVAELARQRRQETTEAAELLGAQTMYGDFADGELTDDYASRMRLVEIFRRFRPTLVIAHAPGDYHADHRAASALAESASWFCSSRGHRTPPPHYRGMGGRSRLRSSPLPPDTLRGFSPDKKRGLIWRLLRRSRSF